MTGGIGGVHRGAAESFDISADLQELARTLGGGGVRRRQVDPGHRPDARIPGDARRAGAQLRAGQLRRLLPARQRLPGGLPARRCRWRRRASSAPSGSSGWPAAWCSSTPVPRGRRDGAGRDRWPDAAGPGRSAGRRASAARRSRPSCWRASRSCRAARAWRPTSRWSSTTRRSARGWRWRWRACPARRLQAPECLSTSRTTVFQMRVVAGRPSAFSMKALGLPALFLWGSWRATHITSPPAARITSTSPLAQARRQLAKIGLRMQEGDAAAVDR